MKTLGISPKVLNPTIVALLAGVILLIAGLDVEGRTLIIGALGVGGIGAASAPGEVVSERPKPSPVE